MDVALEVYFSIAVVLCDMEMQWTFTFVNCTGQGHLVTLGKGHFPTVPSARN